MKKIIVFYPGYIPGKRYGGPVTSMYHFSELLGDEYDIRVVCKNHDFLDTAIYEGINDGWNQIGKAKVRYLSDAGFVGTMFNEIIREIEPDMIYSSSIFSAKMNIPLIKIAKQMNIPMLLAPRGELSQDRLKNKSWKKKPYILFLKVSGILKSIGFQATSTSEYNDIAKVLSVKQQDIFMVPNIPCSYGKKIGQRKERGKIRIVATSRLQHKNNQLYSIKIVNQMKSDVTFDIYGPKEDPEYWKKCEEEMRKAPQNVKYNYKGVLSLAEIEKVYLNYDCLLHPTYSENYGHVIVEALSHECPIVISKGTTPWDDVVDSDAGYVCQLGNDRDFLAALEKIAVMDNEEYELLKKGTQKFTRNLNLGIIKKQYEEMISQLIESKRL